ncbi:MAG: DUF2157 domain-containing protein [Oscillospiraceae bacterium]|nr:DUF2157 domain-containing protein [Oscillospiraceae bacterium]
MAFKINDESKQWVEKGIIDDTQREEILSLYQNERNKNSLLIVFAIIGSLLLGLGVILIFASNWQEIPREIRLFISFLPLLVSMGAVIYTIIKKWESVAFRESTTLGLSISIIATIALVEQVYQIPTKATELICLCMFLMLPIMYLTGAKAPAALYVFCAMWVTFSYEMTEMWIPLISIIVVIPFFVWQFIKVANKGVLWYLTFLADILIILGVYAFADIIDCFEAIMIALFAVAVIVFEAFIKYIKNDNAFSPLSFLSAITLIILHIVASFRNVELHEYLFKEYLAFVYVAALLVITAAYAFMRYKEHRKNELTVYSVTPTDVIIMFALVGIPLHWILSNILLSALGITLIVIGSKRYSFKQLNYGMLIIISVIVARFFDMDIDLLARGIIFILIGAGFIFTNFLLHKKWRAK